MGDYVVVFEMLWEDNAVQGWKGDRRETDTLSTYPKPLKTCHRTFYSAFRTKKYCNATDGHAPHGHDRANEGVVYQDNKPLNKSSASRSSDSHSVMYTRRMLNKEDATYKDDHYQLCTQCRDRHVLFVLDGPLLPSWLCKHIAH